MADKMMEFSSLLKDLVEQAQISGNVLEEGFIREFFSDFNLGEKDYEHIYAYLKASHIEIQGYQTSDEVEEEVKNYKKIAKERMQTFIPGEQEGEGEKGVMEEGGKYLSSAFLEMYFEELKDFEPLTADEEEKLLKQIITEDEEAEMEYIERKLSSVVNLAKNFELSEDYLEELIEEGNIGLLVGISRLKEEKVEGQEKEFLDAFILSAMQDFLDESLDVEHSAHSMISKVGFISDAAKKLEEEKGRVPNLMELAAYTNLSEEEVKEIMKLSADSLIEK